MASLETIVADIAAEMADAPDRGTVADYIPGLAEVNADKFGIAVIEPDGTCHKAGDADEPSRSRASPRYSALRLRLARSATGYGTG